jgi:hypothetical protein
MLQSRNPYDETRGALEANVTAMSASDPAANCQTKSAAGTVAVAHQAIEYAASYFARNTGTVIIDDDGSEVAFGPNGDAYTGTRVPDSVVEKIANDLRDAALVGFGEDRSRLEIDARCAGSNGVLARDASDSVADVDRLALEFLRAAGAREQREIADEPRCIESGAGNRFECRTFRIARIDRRLLRYARYRSERRPQFVRDVGSEVALPLGSGFERSD